MAGQSVGMVASIQPTAEIIAELVEQAIAALRARAAPHPHLGHSFALRA
jgi:enoyl-[acyl-carrier protein] reductase II